MKVIIAGSRSFDKLSNEQKTKIITDAIKESKFHITEVVSGGCYGADISGEKWANLNGIKVTRFFPDWDAYGRYAGPKRNAEMAEYADALILIYDGKSKGSLNMNHEAKIRNLPVYVKEFCKI